MPSELFRLPFAAPIPVGHVVELTYFDGPEQTDFDRPEPLVVDRTTGIAYTCDWHHKEMLGARPVALHHYPPTVRPELVGRAIRGTVVGCTIVAELAAGGAPQTMLLVDHGPTPADEP